MNVVREKKLTNMRARAPTKMSGSRRPSCFRSNGQSNSSKKTSWSK